MTQTTSNATTPHPAVVALPAKAVSTEDWQPDDGNGYFRNFEGEEREVVTGAKFGAHAVIVYAHGVQHDDGSIEDGTDEFFSAPGISILVMDKDGRKTQTDITLTGESARRLADVLVTGANEHDGWSAR
jgi:hypothetical protein